MNPETRPVLYTAALGLHLASIPAALIASQAVFYTEMKAKASTDPHWPAWRWFKFAEPAPGNTHYRPGDSWAEVLGLSAKQQRLAWDVLGVEPCPSLAVFRARWAAVHAGAAPPLVWVVRDPQRHVTWHLLDPRGPWPPLLACIDGAGNRWPRVCKACFAAHTPKSPVPGIQG